MGILEDLDNREIEFPDPKSFRDPYSARARSTIAGQSWVVTHSTRSFWERRRNGKVLISQNTRDGAVYTYQNMDGDDDGSQSETLSTERWGVAGYGRVGKLASWMRKTEYGIEDEAGEVRGDWRPTWTVLVVNNAQGVLEGVDLLASSYYNSGGIDDAVSQVCMQSRSLSKTFLPENLMEIESDAGREEKKRDDAYRARYLSGKGKIPDYTTFMTKAADIQQVTSDGNQDGIRRRCLVM